MPHRSASESLWRFLGTFALGAAAVACGSDVDPSADPTTKPTPGERGPDCGDDGFTPCVEPGGKCTGDDDCAGRCVDAKCAEPTHDDGKRNLDESDIDCGGATAPICADGQRCAANTDCAGLCTDGKCATATHGDGKKNLDETDIDCGGATAPTCVAGKTCLIDKDCEGLCTSGTCAAPSHEDGKKNLDETDVDCGGATAPGCFVGKVCSVSNDCNLQYCKAGACAQPLTDDNIKNGAETDVDCGGPTLTEGALNVTPSRCALTKTCAADSDCASGVCSDTKVCVEAPSCRPRHGGATCGTGETSQAGANHESCCKTLPVSGLTMSHMGVTKQVYVDKYEITAGRVREWVRAIRAQYGGVGNVRAWVTAKMAADSLVQTQLSAHTAYLPSREDGESYAFPKSGGGTTAVDIGMMNQLGPTSYHRGPGLGAPTATSGCGMYDGAFGHRTYWFDAAERTYFGEIPRPVTTKEQLDEKSMNCLTPAMYAAFCAWDGGYLVTQAAAQAAYGPDNYPWGSQAPKTDPQKRANVNNGVTAFSPANPPRYVYPIVNYGTFEQDFTPVIAAPGRFPLDVSPVRPANDSWMDFGGNMIEVVQNGTAFSGYAGGSWEGHESGRAMNGAVVAYDKYGKTGARCMRLR
ncbi:MAG: hypothetical protein J0I07_24750 [Myxococcales bacterium]|nr:hypothetical protein [Myxococcales bacterium]